MHAVWDSSSSTGTTVFCLVFLSGFVILQALEAAAAESSCPLCLQETPDPLQMEAAKGCGQVQRARTLMGAAPRVRSGSLKNTPLGPTPGRKGDCAVEMVLCPRLTVTHQDAQWSHLQAWSQSSSATAPEFWRAGPAKWHD